MSRKYSINLLTPELLPEKDALTLGRMVTIWGLTLIVMLVLAFVSRQFNANATQKFNQAQQENKAVKEKLERLEAELASDRIDSKLTERLALLKTTINNRFALHEKLTDSDQTFVKGFSSAMNELSTHHHKDIRLEQVTITSSNLVLAGVAKKPEAVPVWLDGFEQTSLLSGKAFANFKLVENDEKLTQFVVSSVELPSVANGGAK